LPKYSLLQIDYSWKNQNIFTAVTIHTAGRMYDKLSMCIRPMKT